MWPINCPVRYCQNSAACISSLSVEASVVRNFTKRRSEFVGEHPGQGASVVPQVGPLLEVNLPPELSVCLSVIDIELAAFKVEELKEFA